MRKILVEVGNNGHRALVPVDEKNVNLAIELPYVNPKCAGAEIKIMGNNEVNYTIFFDNKTAARLLLEKLQKELL